MMKRENGRVVIDVADDQYANFLMLLGYATQSSAQQGNFFMCKICLETANAMNEGNPNYTPYRIPGDDEDLATAYANIRNLRGPRANPA